MLKVSPPFEYVTHHIPKLLTGGLPLAILGILTSTEIFSLLLPFAAFVAGLSLLGHKEWRFVVYVVPMANVAAAKGAAWLSVFFGLQTLYRLTNNVIISWKKRRSSLASIIRLFVPGLLVGTLLVTLAQTLVSMKNYPGGHALRVLHQRYNISQGSFS
jgi:alpha-1,6-mannosyltransferase